MHTAKRERIKIRFGWVSLYEKTLARRGSSHRKQKALGAKSAVFGGLLSNFTSGRQERDEAARVTWKWEEVPSGWGRRYSLRKKGISVTGQAVASPQADP